MKEEGSQGSKGTLDKGEGRGKEGTGISSYQARNPIQRSSSREGGAHAHDWTRHSPDSVDLSYKSTFAIDRACSEPVMFRAFRSLSLIDA